MISKSDKSWATAVERHSGAVSDFIERAAALDAATWACPIDDGKWTPAQITQHLIQTYEALLRQLETGEGLRVQTGWLLRQLLRVTLLVPIVALRRLPPGAKAPRDLRPGTEPRPQSEAIEELRSVAASFQSQVHTRRNEPGLVLTHHIFGAVGIRGAFEFVTIHTEHHARQIPRLASTARAS